MTEINRNLNPRQLGQLMHGSARELNTGDVVTPIGRGSKASRHGSLGYHWGQRADEHAFATEHEAVAWDFAMSSARGRMGEFNNSPRGRPRVYLVAPSQDIQYGVFHPKHPLRARGRGPVESFNEYTSKTGFEVTGVHDIQPGHQGTFSDIDWNEYKRPGHPAEANHPDWFEVKHGNAGSSIRREAIDRASEEYLVEHPPRTIPMPGQERLRVVGRELQQDPLPFHPPAR